MKALHEEGTTYRELGSKFNVSTSTVQYHLNENTKLKTRIRASKYNRTHSKTPEAKARCAAFMKTPAGKKSVAKSWIRNYLNNEIITIDDVKEVLDEYK